MKNLFNWILKKFNLQIIEYHSYANNPETDGLVRWIIPSGFKNLKIQIDEDAVWGAEINYIDINNKITEPSIR